MPSKTNATAATTRPDEITTQAGPKFATKTKPAGASHDDLIQSRTPGNNPRVHVETNPVEVFVGQSGFGSVYGAFDRPEDAPGDCADLEMWNARGDSGSVSTDDPRVFLNDPRPAAQGTYGSARTGATPGNGSHSLDNPCSTPRPNMKSADFPLDVMKATMRRL